MSDNMHISVLYGIIALTSGFVFVFGGIYDPYFARRQRTFYIWSSDAKPGYLIGRSAAVYWKNNPLTYTLVGWDAEYFRYNVTNSGMYVDKTLPSDRDYFAFYIQAEDKDNNVKAYQAILIRKRGVPFVSGGNYKPFFMKKVLLFVISCGNAKPGYFLGKSSALDGDNEPLTYTLVGQYNEYFRYNVTDSGIYVKKKLPSDHRYFTFNVKAEDKDYNKAYQNIIIKMT